ncbi:unnamed protein product [Heligmosomoides polygyrus]|uniref:C2 domain-containing protein n=1 Tax=Heligmosomoides polygyrus TaxID=6339 RepID=A0A3P7YXL0_HELPZ|nr:unnamed protein product [Heligmosomoides polygyrus]
MGRRSEQHDDEFEKYEPRPKIVIDRRDFEPSRPYNGDDGIEDTTPTLRIVAQYVEQKNIVLVKVVSLHHCDLLADDVSQVRLSLKNQKTKLLTAIVRGQEPVFNQTFSIPGIDTADGEVSVLSPGEVWCQFADLGRMETLIGVGGKSESGTWYRVHFVAGASSDCATT